MASQILYLLVALALVGSHASWAQTYRYQTPDGRWTISNTPPADATEVIRKYPRGADPPCKPQSRSPHQKGL
jgi:hypothetical protein